MGRRYSVIGALMAGTFLLGTVLLSGIATRVQAFGSSRHGFLLAAAFVYFLLLLLVMGRAAAVSRRTIIAASILLVGISISSTHTSSDDATAYAFYGKMAATYQINPAVHAPIELASDPWFDDVSKTWRDQPTVYGPLFTSISAAVVRLSGSRIGNAVFAFQLIAGLALLGALGILGWRGASARTLASIGLNPLMIVIVVNGAHNDVVAGAAILAAVVLAEKGRFSFAGLAAAAGTLIKLTALAPAGLLAIALLARGRRKPAVTYAASLGLVVVAVYAIAGGLRALQPVADASSRVGFSIWERASQVSRLARLRGEDVPLVEFPPAPEWLTPALASIAIIVCLIGPWRSLAANVAAGSMVFIFGGAYVLPWYPALLLPLTVSAGRKGLTAALIAGQAILTAMYLAALAPWHGPAWIRYVQVRSYFGFWGVFALSMLVFWSLAGRVRLVLHRRQRVRLEPAQA